MQKLISELTRLYLPAGTLSPEVLAQHVLGQTTLAVNLTTDDGLTRAMVIAFDKVGDSEDAQHWSLLCAVANAFQAELGFPAPAVSISGANGYALWLSLETPVPAAQAQRLLELLRRAYFPDIDLRPETVSAPVELPPCLHQRTGKWAAFIHPGMGASFADESGLEMAPPFAGQAAFLTGLHSISEAQFRQALARLEQSHGAAPVLRAQAPAHAATADGLLLKDATLEDIVKFLHAKNIEPTFRHVIPK
ncbi:MULTISPECIES: TOTE conflict system archaeo-eukaryotic primase domain-containing protein [unclassified Janthinobacterium]|uniref:TOTE conflict system archaeo-eukaryotic primase domain-containing protein n=1 Tax=unclassified Janthinobacterium TaxID=2610881 RepID=UPI00034C8ADF|nr:MULTISPECIES: hypothetical protein [unclassified Janthinobacterium]MEC5164036.1 hypothetical protein [Janthinobacterium sp. CG_S6]